LFDDVDVSRLRRYLDEQSGILAATLGSATVSELWERTEKLQVHQDKWKHQHRHERGTDYQLTKRRLSDERATYYQNRPLRWYLREIRRAARGGDLGRPGHHDRTCLQSAGKPLGETAERHPVRA
jgi:hypothetical protein